MLTYFRGATARHHHFMAVAILLAQATLFSKPSILLHRNAINGFSFSIPFSSSSAHRIQTHKSRQPVVSVLELGGVKIGRDVVMFIIEIPLIQLTTLFFIRWKVFVSSFQVIGRHLEWMARNVEMRWIDTYFPFTNPSFELEIYFQGVWGSLLSPNVKNKMHSVLLFWTYRTYYEGIAFFNISMVDIVSTFVAQNIGDILMINPKIKTLLRHARHNNVVY
ncbi:hypothetical protein PVL29_026300 [Vitis rotundifolia]|uniref:Uncharacterized protein n=1 Tax=Vitis rotundifolia TaxID=103349 RepID=A0AA38YM45_VITRO|nr:hypothetical protein PVL29_026300 [Vitis rotundifolia]